MKKIAIIGGGVGGLTTALLLSNQGYSVTIFEQNSELGGRVGFVGNDLYHVDRGPTIVLLPEMIKEILAEGGFAFTDDDMIMCEPMYQIHYGDGTILNKYSDADKQIAELQRLFPGEEANFRRYMQQLESWFVAGKPAFLEKVFLSLRNMMNWRTIHLLHKLKVHRNVYALAKSFFRHPKLRDAFSLQTLYIGGAPQQTPALYSLIPFAEHAFGIWYVRGGYGSLIPRMEQTLIARGVTIHKNTKVEQLINENNRYTGVIANGISHSFSHIVYNGDFPSIAKVMGPGPTQKGQAPMRKYVPSSGCLLLYLGVDKLYDEATVHQFVLPDTFQEQLKALFGRGEIPENPSYYVFNPSLIDDTLAPPGHSVLYFLVPVPAGNHQVDWANVKQKLTDQVITMAEQQLFPDLRNHIQWQKVRTPEDAEREGLYMGGSFGIAPTLGQSAVWRPQVKPVQQDGLYAVGASVHPGGGVPIVMQGAKLVADLISKE